jgi:hypothetical protein
MHNQGTNPQEIFSSGQKNGIFFKGFTIEYIDRNKNSEVDALVKAAAHNNPLPAHVFLQTITNASIKIIETEPIIINIIQGEDL